MNRCRWTKSHGSGQAEHPSKPLPPEVSTLWSVINHGYIPADHSLKHCCRTFHRTLVFIDILVTGTNAKRLIQHFEKV